MNQPWLTLAAHGMLVSTWQEERVDANNPDNGQEESDGSSDCIDGIHDDSMRGLVVIAHI